MNLDISIRNDDRGTGAEVTSPTEARSSATDDVGTRDLHPTFGAGLLGEQRTQLLHTLQRPIDVIDRVVEVRAEP